MRSMSKYPYGATGRDIIDDVVKKNAHINPAMYEQTKSIPAYFGAVEIGEDPVKFTSPPARSKVSNLSLICDIINSVDSMKLTDGEATVKRLVNDEFVSVRTTPSIIKLIKACTVASYSKSHDFCFAVSEFLKTLLDQLPTVVFPLGVYVQNDVQKVIADELEEYLKVLLERDKVEYQCTQPKKTGRVRDILASIN